MTFFFVPDFGRNILSFSQLIKQVFRLNVNSNEDIDIYIKGNLITTACLINDMFYLKPIYHEIYDTSLNNELQREGKNLYDFNDRTYMWHLRLGHIGLDMIKRLVKESLLDSLE